MPLRGRAFLTLWSGVLPGYERELDRWHTIEHMPERLGVPGFLRGRRYTHTAASDHPLFILYEAAHIETFRSPGLVARLNDPTEWSKKVQPGLVNFVRSPCHTLISLGDGLGGALMPSVSRETFLTRRSEPLTCERGSGNRTTARGNGGPYRATCARDRIWRDC